MSRAFVREPDGDEELDDADEAPAQAPPGGGPQYITPAGYRRLQDELNHLWRVERPKVAREVEAAAALGDRSENAEYIYGKRRLREIDRRLRFLKKRLEALTVVESTPEHAGRVFFGAHVTVEDEDGARSTYRIVGADEIDLGKHWISSDSPVGKALLGKRLDEEVVVKRPKGEVVLLVVDIRYES